MVILNCALAYLLYENVVGLWVTITNKESAYVPPTIMYARAREKHLLWKEDHK